jgi:hypothetical protein
MPNGRDGERPDGRAAPKDYPCWKLALDDIVSWCKIELPCFKGLEVVSMIEAGRPLH